MEVARIIGGKKRPSSLKEWLTWQLRRLSYRWPPRSAAFAAARCTLKDFLKRPGIDPRKVSARIRKFFRCGLCGKVFPRREVSADHVDPVVDPKRGWQSWDEYLKRLFCEEDGFQIICNECHDDKTARERKVRQRYKNE